MTTAQSRARPVDRPRRPRITPVVAWLGRPRNAAIVAGLTALVFLALAPHGEDAAAHLYQTDLWRQHGWRFWDNNWYAGRYSQINYSLLYYPLAAVLGTWTVVVGSVAWAAAAFASLISRRWPSRALWPAATFTLLAPLPVLTGTYPFLLGLAAALATLAAIQRQAWRTATILGIVVALAHLLALFLLCGALLALGIRHRVWATPGPRRRMAIGFVVIVALTLISWRAFSAAGTSYPFTLEDFLIVVAFCVCGLVLAWSQDDMGDLIAVLATYLIITIVAFAISSPLGSNVGRLAAYLGAPLLLIPLASRRFRPRGLAVLIVTAALTWQVYPVATGVRAASATPSASEEFWYPVEAFLGTNADPNYRAGVVATDQHWEAFYLAQRGIPLTRGWYRQDDFPANAALYRELTPRRYRRWLDRQAVNYVFLPADRLDYSAAEEARLLREGVLPVIARRGAWTIYEVPNPTPLATPATSITVADIDGTSITLDAQRARTYRLRVNYTPYWDVANGAACATPAKNGQTNLRVFAPGRIRLEFRVGVGTVVDEVIGRSESCRYLTVAGPLAPTNRRSSPSASSPQDPTPAGE